MALPTRLVEYTTREAKVLGSTCRNMMRKSLAPMARDASIYGISLMLNATERMTRVNLGVNTMVMAMMILVKDAVNSATRARASTREGKAISASTKRCRTRSYLPPK